MRAAKTTFTNKRKKRVMSASESNKGHAKLHIPRTGPIGCMMQMGTEKQKYNFGSYFSLKHTAQQKKNFNSV